MRFSAQVVPVWVSNNRSGEAFNAQQLIANTGKGNEGIKLESTTHIIDPVSEPDLLHYKRAREIN